MAKIPGPLAWVMLARRAAKHEDRSNRKAFASGAAKGLAKNLFKQFNGMSIQLIWDARELTRGLANAQSAVQDIAYTIAEYQAPRVEAYMKMNARWHDVTGNARSGLRAEAYQDGSETGIVLYHSVPYGIYLETRWDGRLGIIDPTIAAMGPEVMAQFERALDRERFY